MQSTHKDVDNYVSSGDYQQSLASYLNIVPAIDDFFEHTMVMVEDKQLQANRLAMFKQLQSILRQVADFNYLA